MNGNEKRRRLAERARRAGLTVAAERERLAAEGERPLAPGDLFTDRRTAELPVEWAVVDQEPAAAAGEPRGAATGDAGAGSRGPSGTGKVRLLVVPADSLPLRGPADVAVSAATNAGTGSAERSPGPLTLRCAHGVWIEPARLETGGRTARLSDRAVAQAAERHRAAAEVDSRPSGTPLEREAAIDPEYRHWVESVLVPARQMLAAAAGAGVGTTGAPPELEPKRPERTRDEEAPEPAAPLPPASLTAPRDRGSRMPGSWALAASILLLLAAGLLAGLLRQRHEVTELRAAERRLTQQLADLGAEQTTLRGERERMERRLAGLAEERRELADRASAAEAAQRSLRERVGELDRRLREALSPRVWIDPIALLVPYEPTRGDPEALELPAEATQLGLLLQHDAPDGPRRYRLELYRGDEELPIWAAEDVPWQEEIFGFFVALPRDLLAPGEYRLQLYATSVPGMPQKVEAYEMVVRAEGQPSR